MSVIVLRYKFRVKSLSGKEISFFYTQKKFFAWQTFSRIEFPICDDGSRKQKDRTVLLHLLCSPIVMGFDSEIKQCAEKMLSVLAAMLTTFDFICF